MSWLWKSFSPQEVACPCCGEIYNDVISMNAIQEVRNIIGKPILLNSAHRCGIHNAKVGGAPMSMHKKLAFDISLRNHDKYELLEACKRVGFKGYGYYQTFLHVDMGRPRFWYSGDIARKLWNG